MSLQRDRLKMRQLSGKLVKLASLRTVPPPRKGWINEIRRALGMSAKQLAGRMNVSRPAVSQYEKGEADGTISLHTLQAAASALGCELVYAIVPTTRLEDLTELQARRVATRTFKRVLHSMHLEQQDVSEEETAKQIEDLSQQLLTDRPRTLWDDIDVEN